MTTTWIIIQHLQNNVDSVEDLIHRNSLNYADRPFYEQMLNEQYEELASVRTAQAAPTAADSLSDPPAQRPSSSRCTMAQTPRITEPTTTPNKVNNTSVRTEDDIARQGDHYIQRLEAQAADYKRERSTNKLRLEAETRNRGHLKRLSRMYHRDRRSILGTFLAIKRSRSIFEPARRQRLEVEWFKWVEKELQFAKEVREAFKRVDGCRNASSSGSDDGARKRFRS
jgi:hypothetical protein